MSNFDAADAINSMAQQANPIGIGHTECCRIQFMTASVRVTITSPSTFELYARVSVWRFISARNVRVLSIVCKRQIPKKPPFQQIWREALGTATMPSSSMINILSKLCLEIPAPLPSGLPCLYSCTRNRSDLPLSSLTRHRKYSNSSPSIYYRRGDRVAECAALEMLCAGNGTEGSNPSLSAISCWGNLDVLPPCILIQLKRIKVVVLR